VLVVLLNLIARALGRMPAIRGRFRRAHKA